MTALAAGVTVAAVRAWQAAMEKSAAGRLAASLGVHHPRDRGPHPDDLAAALADGARVRQAFAALPEDARDLALAKAAAGDSSWSDAPHELLARSLGWNYARIDGARRALTAAGWVSGTAWDWELPPGTGPALLPGAFSRFSAAPGTVPPARWGFLLGCVAALASHLPVRVRGDGQIYAAWHDKTEKAHGFDVVPRPALARVVSILEDLRVLHVDASRHDRALTTDFSSLDRALGASDHDLALASFHHDNGEFDESARMLAALTRIERATPGEAATPDRIAEMLGDLHRAEAAGFSYGRTTKPRPRELMHALRELHMMGLVTAGGDAEDPRYAIAPSAAAADGRWIVQPNYDVLVPEDTPPADVARLSAVASLARFDRVATFRISRESMARGTAVAAGAGDPVALLASRSAGPVPENVAATLRGWARSSAPMIAWKGAVIVAESEEQRAFLRAHRHFEREIAPGVFAFAESALREVVREAEKRGHGTAAPAATRVRGGPGDRSGAADLARNVRRRIEDAVSAAIAQPKPKKPAAGGRTARRRAPAESPEVRWPRVHEIVSDDIVLRVLVGMLGPDELDDLEELDDDDILFQLEAARDGLADALGGPVPKRRVAASGPGPSRNAPAQAAAPAKPASKAPPDAARPAPPAPPQPGEAGPPWQTPAPGALADLLREAMASRTWIEILYVNTAGRRKPQTVFPVSIDDGARPALSAVSADSGSAAAFVLERIAAVRTLPK
ncbi:MAG: hypothetical protein HMLKMBBP_01392 [Planctomycetes bacterium]|nr:hypothetical protein [Planctomycetota bacterium]